MDTASPTLWLSAAGLGAFHGINPAMGWLFAVALGLYAHSRRVVLLSLVPIALGHAVSVALVLAGAFTLGSLIDHAYLNCACGVLLIGWGVWRLVRGHRGRPAVGMRTGLAGLGLWSFLMSSAHGAGLMLIPVLLPLCGVAPVAGARAAGSVVPGVVLPGVIALTVHTLAMLAVIAAISMFVYQRAGLGFLRTGWVNVDLLWSAALIGCGLVLFVL
jgi:hypothetical protein